MKNRVLFSEKQQFRSIWAFLPLIIAVIGLGISTYKIIVEERSLLSMLFALSFTLAVSFLFFLMRMETTITNEEIIVRFYPFIKKQIAWAEIERAFVRTYKPLWEYGGWGIRMSYRNGKAYNIAGNKGLQLVLKNGERILIGTQKEGELEAVLRQVHKQNALNQ